MYLAYFESPIGFLKIIASDIGLQQVQFCESIESEVLENRITQKTIEQLHLFFKGNLHNFTIELDLHGTPFQKKVWQQLSDIAFGTTISYLQQAIRLGDQKVIRASANANAKNPIAIIIPCHRVIGTQGKLTGYAGALWRKQWLLEFEARQTGKLLTLF